MKKKKLPQVSTEIRQLHADFCMYDFGDEELWKKLKCRPEIGLRIHWYYKDEEEFDKEEGWDCRANARSSGILVPRPDAERHSEDYGDYMVCCDCYPVEKENPMIDWFSLARLLDAPNLVEVFAKE